MTEEEARVWVADRFGATATDKVAAIGDAVRAEASRQNLIAPSTLDHLWSRHLTDSAQLVSLAGDASGPWVDVGTGAGFPGLVAAALFAGKVLLVEPRQKRASFLREVCDALGLDNAFVVQSRAESVAAAQAGIITARAVASADALLAMTAHLRGPRTRYILPRGQAGAGEVEQLRRTWRGMFHVEHSVTDEKSIIITATGVAGRCSVSP